MKLIAWNKSKAEVDGLGKWAIEKSWKQDKKL